jgi:hypothetical protein
VILCVDCKKAIPKAPEEFIKLEGLDKESLYSLDGEIYGGDYLMNKGLLFINNSEHSSYRFIFKKC